MMMDADLPSTRPYLIRALYDWCSDNGFTPYVAVKVDASVQVPREYVQGGEIVLNVSMDATSSLKLGNSSSNSGPASAVSPATSWCRLIGSWPSMPEKTGKAWLFQCKMRKMPPSHHRLHPICPMTPRHLLPPLLGGHRSSGSNNPQQRKSGSHTVRI